MRVLRYEGAGGGGQSPLGIDGAVFLPLIESPIPCEAAAEEAAVDGSPEPRERASTAIAAAARM